MASLVSFIDADSLAARILVEKRTTPGRSRQKMTMLAVQLVKTDNSEKDRTYRRENRCLRPLLAHG